MGYIEKNLMENEKVVYSAQLHFIVYVWPFLLGLAALVMMAIPMDDQTQFLVKLAAGVILLVIAFIWAVNINGGKQYVVTNRRLIFKRGIVKRESLELLLRKCEGVKIEQSVAGRLLNYGTVIVTTGEASNRYSHIKSPLAFSTHINQQIDNLKIGE
ncbi:MAG: PH domain-containing protein [Prevotella sp.]|nr:PH domain-containing protein [Prevotella sp.]